MEEGEEVEGKSEALLWSRAMLKFWEGMHAGRAERKVTHLSSNQIDRAPRVFSSDPYGKRMG